MDDFVGREKSEKKGLHLNEKKKNKNKMNVERCVGGESKLNIDRHSFSFVRGRETLSHRTNDKNTYYMMCKKGYQIRSGQSV